MPAWPVALPQAPMIEGYSETAPNLTVRTQMDAGPAKIRRRFTTNIRQIQWSNILTTSQIATLDSFFLNDLGGGAVSYTAADPRTGNTVNYRFLEPPTYNPISHDRWRVDLKLEIIP